METSSISRKNVGQMFNNISRTYDRVNRILTCGIDLLWRRKVAKFAPSKEGLLVCDLATGTADQILALKHLPVRHFYGYDIAEKMLSIGEKKLKDAMLDAKSTLSVGSALSTALPENSMDFVTMSFGIRNVENPALCLEEIYRILRPGGSFCILEFSLPRIRMLRFFYLFYLRKILPHLGRLFSKDASAYTYLNQTIETFPYGAAFTNLVDEAGFAKSAFSTDVFGVVSYYRGIKP